MVFLVAQVNVCFFIRNMQKKKGKKVAKLKWTKDYTYKINNKLIKNHL